MSDVEWLVNYGETPDKTSVPGQTGYDPTVDIFREKPSQKASTPSSDVDAFGEWWTKPRGERTGGTGLDAVHVDAVEALRLRHELERQQRISELRYEGAGQRQHAAQGSNLGEPSWSGSGGAAFFSGSPEWIYEYGSPIGQAGVALVQSLESWNIYEGQ